jgi:hypothetical protein
LAFIVAVKVVDAEADIVVVVVTKVIVTAAEVLFAIVQCHGDGTAKITVGGVAAEVVAAALPLEGRS